jgi:hypothetical protein
MLGIRFVKKGPVALKRNEWNAIKRDIYEELGVHWHDEFRPKHFTNRGATEYGYTPRQGENMGKDTKGFFRTYTGRKLRKFGHTRPLVKTGVSEKLCKIRDVRATRNGVRVVIHARTFNRTNPGTQINMREEITAFSDREDRELGRVGNDGIQRQLDQFKRTETTTIK